MTKISALPEDTAPTTDDYTVTIDQASGATKKVKWLNLGSLFSGAILPLVYPVGCLFMNTDGSDPATTLGFGTWVRYAKGQALVGVADNGTFSTPGTAVGNERHSITWGEMPAHNHGVNDPGHNHSSANGQAVAIAASSTNHLTLSGTAQQITWGNTTTSWNGTGISTQNAGNGDSMSLVQPSMPVYVFTRTA